MTSNTQAKSKAKPHIGLWAGLGFLLGNGKSLALATKAGGLLKFAWLFTTIGSLLVSLAGWAIFFGWRFASLIVALLLIHEMGHWLWMKCYRLNPTSPIFVPFFGAFVAMRNLPSSEATRAWVAFAGPFVGGVTSAILFFIGNSTGSGLLISASELGFLINLMQLVPVKPFDGGFVVGSISRWLLIPGILLALLIGAAIKSIFFILIGLLSLMSLFGNPGAAEAQAPTYTGDAKTLAEFELELQRKAENTSPAEEGAASIASLKTTPATGKQRLAIGLAYLVLLFSLGGFQLSAIIAAQQNKDCIRGDNEMLSQIIKFKPELNSYERRGANYIKLGQYDLALADLKTAQTMGSKQYEVYQNLAFAQFSLNRPQGEVVASLVKARSLCEDLSVEGYEIGYDFAMVGATQEALKTADKCIPRYKKSLQALVFVTTGHPEEARKALDASIAEKSIISGYGPYCRRALLEMADKKFADAEKDVKQAKENAGHFEDGQPIPLLTEGWLTLCHGDAIKAISQTDAVLLILGHDYQHIDRSMLVEACHALKKIAYTKLADIADSSDAKRKLEAQATEESAKLTPRALGKNPYIMWKAQTF